MITPLHDVDERNLPLEADFDPVGCDLDAQCAWKNFGGRSLKEAYSRFCEVPESYQEDFMFMGGRAFHFYFPVIDEYLRTIVARDEFDVCPAEILAACIAAQFDWRGAEISMALKDRVLQLCTFVRSHLHHYAQSSKEQAKIGRAWAKLEKSLR